MKNEPETWNKLKALSTIIASIFVPIAIVIIGNSYSTALKESEIQVRYVELAVEILKEDPSKKRSNMREWAVDLINNYSEIEIDLETRNELLRDPLFKEIDDFVAETYAPFIVGYVLDAPGIQEEFKTTINSGEKKEIKKMFTEFVISAFHQLEQKKKELKTQTNSNKPPNLENSKLEQIQRKIKELKKKN
jgi:SMC interacting uncharacterized protein involved in chromosome segregation|tara:strand:+ start:84 stop:656 length:573 start_codon:yes stop_codon:yes gene_type:complete